MTSPFETSPAVAGNLRAGFSMMEMLVVLAILAMAMGVVVSGKRGASPALQAERQAAALVRDASALRERAIRQAVVQSLDTAGLACGEGNVALRFFPDGTAMGPELCFGAFEPLLRVDPLAGRLVRAAQ